MRICFLNFDGAPTIKAAVNNRIGGLNTILFNLLKSFSLLSEIKPTVVYRKDGSRVLSSDDTIGCQIVKIEAGRAEVLNRSDLEDCLPQFVDGVRKFFQKQPPDIVHTSGSEAGIAMCRLREDGLNVSWVHTNYATLTVRKVVIEGISPREALSDAIGQRELRCLIGCDHVIALSEVDKEEICGVFQIPSDKVSVALPGIDRDVFHPPGRGSVRNPIVVSAGRMSKIKDFLFLLKGFQLVDKLNPGLGARLLIIGGNKQERKSLGLIDSAERLGILEKVVFLDGTSQDVLAQYFRSAKVFAGASKHETFGLLPVEARACGTPFVVRSNSSYLVTAVDGCGGYFSDNNSESDMAEKLSCILNLGDRKWQAMSDNAVQSVREFSWPRTAETCLAIYRRLEEKRKT